MKRYASTNILAIAVIGLLIWASNGFPATVETPMTEDLDANGYAIFNVGALLATNVAAADVIAAGPSADVRAYGAVGDGTNDDTSAIQDAIDANTSILIPKGHTFVVSGLNVPSDRTLFGGGKLRLQTGSTSHLLSGTGCSNITIRELELDGADIGTALSGIFFIGPGSSYRLLNCRIHNFTQSGISLNNEISDIMIAGNQCYSNLYFISSSGGFGIYMQGCANAIVTGNTCRDNTQDGICCTYGGTGNNEYFVIANNFVEGHTYFGPYSAGIWVELHEDRQARAVIANNVCRGNSRGIVSTDPSSSMAIVGNVVEGLSIYDWYHCGILSRGGTVQNNVVKAFCVGILSDAFETLTLHANYIYDCNEFGMWICPDNSALPNKELIVTDNQILENNIGIVIEPIATDVRNLVLTGNMTRMRSGGAGALYLLNRTNKVETGIIAHNNFTDFNPAYLNSAEIGKVIFADNIGVAVQTVTDNTTMSWQETLLVNASGGARTMTLPAPAHGRVVTLKKTDSSTNAVTIQGNTGETIDGSATTLLTNQWNSVTVCSDGYSWYRQ